MTSSQKGASLLAAFQVVKMMGEETPAPLRPLSPLSRFVLWSAAI